MTEALEIQNERSPFLTAEEIDALDWSHLRQHIDPAASVVNVSPTIDEQMSDATIDFLNQYARSQGATGAWGTPNITYTYEIKYKPEQPRPLNNDERQIAESLWARDRTALMMHLDYHKPEVQYFRNKRRTTCIVYDFGVPILVGQVSRYYKDKENHKVAEKMAFRKAILNGLIGKTETI